MISGINKLKGKNNENEIRPWDTICEDTTEIWYIYTLLMLSLLFGKADQNQYQNKIKKYMMKLYQILVTFLFK